jgi:hypothetical protein
VSWAFRNAGTVGTSFNATCTPGTPATIVAGDLLIIAATEFIGSDARPAAPSGWTDITLGVNWTTACAVYAKIAAGSDAMPAIASWGNAFQLAVCLVYSGGPATLTGLVDTTHSSDRIYNSVNALVFNNAGVPTNANSLVVAISFKNTLGNGSPVLTETGGLIGFNRRVTSWPNAVRPTIVIDDTTQTTPAAITSPGMSMSFAESSTQAGQSTILIFNPAPNTIIPSAGQESFSGQTPSVVGATNSVLVPLTA